MRNRRHLLWAAALALLPLRAESFSSKGLWDNHSQITRAAIDELARSGESPDLVRYRTILIDHSTDEDAHHDLYVGQLTWNQGKENYERKMRELHQEGEFARAYEHLGYSLHLLEDDFSPPHIYQVHHEGYTFDGFEFHIAPLVTEVPASDPGFGNAHGGEYPFTILTHWWLRARQNDDKERYLAAVDQRRFWLSDEKDDDDRDDTTNDRNDDKEPDGDAAYGITAEWGSYGGQYHSNDRIPGNVNREGDWVAAPEVREVALRIARQQIWEAKEAVRKKLDQVSRTLPPVSRGYIVGEGKVEVPSLDANRGLRIVFEILENRKPDLKVTLHVIGRGPIKDAYGVSWDARAVPTAPSQEGLPYAARKVEVLWKGELADGTSALTEVSSTGREKLRLIVDDADGNRTPATVRLFPIKPDTCGHYVWDVSVGTARPYLRELLVTQGSSPVYRGSWTDRDSRRRLEEQARAIHLKAGPPLRLRASFNTPIDEVKMEVMDSSVAMKPKNPDWPTVWEGECPVESLLKYRGASWLNVVIAGTDRSRAALDSEPSTIARYDGRAQYWEGYEAGSDSKHRIPVEPVRPPFVRGVEVHLGGNTIYRARWSDQGEMRRLDIPERGPIREEGEGKILIDFEGEVDPSSVQVRIGDASAKGSSEPRRWTGTFDTRAAVVLRTSDQTIPIEIQARSPEGLQLDARPSTVAHFDRSARVWRRYESERDGADDGRGGYDTCHELGQIENSWVLVLDASKSMSEGNRLPNVKAGIRRLLQRMGPNDEVALIVFMDCHDIRVAQPFTLDKAKVEGALGAVSTGAGTPLFDSAKFAREYLAANGRGRKKHPPLVYSDGEETCRGTTPGPPKPKEDVPPQQWTGYRVEQSTDSRGFEQVFLIVVRYIQEATGRGARASLVQDRYPVYYSRTRVGNEETGTSRWGVSPQPIKGGAPETASDSEGIRRLREKANSLRKNLTTREEANKEIDKRVKEITR